MHTISNTSFTYYHTNQHTNTMIYRRRTWILILQAAKVQMKINQLYIKSA